MAVVANRSLIRRPYGQSRIAPLAP